MRKKNMSELNQLPESAVVVIHQVVDGAKWKARFDATEKDRREAGILGHHLNRGADEPNLLSIYLPVVDITKAKAFGASPNLQRVMAEAGVVGTPQFIWMKPVLEDIISDRELPAMIVSHTVADFNKWFAGYKAADAIRKQGGIIGHAVNQALDDPNTVIVYHQAESHEAFRAFMETPELKTTMERLGVTSVPQVTFHTGGWAKTYGATPIAV